MNKIIVAGSRNVTDYSLVESKLDYYFQNLDPKTIEIVSGGARGVDKLGERYAKEHGLACKVFPADWNRFGRSAGYKRNCEMGSYATHLVAFWDGQSPGTKHMIEYAKKRNLNIRIVKS